MTEYQRETDFLRRIIRFDQTDERLKLEERIAQVQRDQCCVRRAVSLLTVFTVLCAAGLAYGVILQENFSYGKDQFTSKLLCELGVASLIPLAALSGLLLAYRRKLNRFREECRRLVTKLMESHLGSSFWAESGAPRYRDAICCRRQRRGKFSGNSSKPAFVQQLSSGRPCERKRHGGSIAARTASSDNVAKVVAESDIA